MTTKLQSVATIATFSALVGLSDAARDDGAMAFVKTLKSYFALDKARTAATDLSTTSATASGTGRWVRQIAAHPSNAIVADWYIDAVNGNDEFDGISAVTALKTGNEWARRVFQLTLLPPVNVGTFRVCTVHVLTDLPTTDALFGTCFLAPNAFIEFRGTPTVVQSGSFTTVVAKAPATNVPYQLTDTSLAAANTWSSFIQNGRRVRITSGANAEVRFWVAKDLGSKTARMSEPVLMRRFDPAGATGWPNAVAVSNGSSKVPAVADAYSLEQLATVNLGSFNIRPLDANSNGTFGANRVVFTELNVRGDFDLGFSHPLDSFYVFWGCSFAGFVTGSNVTASYNGCSFAHGMIVCSGVHTFGACLTAGNLVCLAAPGSLLIDVDTMCQGAGISGFGVYISQASIFDNAGNAVTVGVPQSGRQGIPSFCALLNGNGTTARIYGSGNTGAGVYVDAGSCLGYHGAILAGLTVTGSTPGTNDFVLGGRTTSRAWDETNGVFTAARTNSWANLQATVATTGFGGNPVDMTSGARIAQAA